MKETYKLLSKLRSSKVDVGNVKKTYTVDESVTKELYDEIKADGYLIQEDIILILKGTSGEEIIFGDGENPYSTSVKTSAGGGQVTWTTLADKPTTFPPTIGTTATTAKAGNYTPPDVTTTVKGLMLATDKVKLNGIAEGATANTAAAAAPLAAGTAAVGTSALYAREDHRHPLQPTVAALTTGRTFTLTGGATGTSAAFTGAANASIAVTLAVPTDTVRGGVLKQTNIPDLNGEIPIDYTHLNALYAVIRGMGGM